jgi:hypothetical protein
MNYFSEKYLTLVGNVQSGKTHEEIQYTWESVKHHNVPVIFVIRNIIADQLQLMTRFKPFDIHIKPVSELTLATGVSFLNSKGVIIALCNQYQLFKVKKILALYHGRYNVCIDEVDFSIKTRNMDSLLDRFLTDIKHKATHILGATATPMALLHDTTIGSFKKMKNKDNYRGINELIVKHVKSGVFNKADSDCEAIYTIYDSLLKKDNVRILHTVSKKKMYHYSLLEFLHTTYPQFTVLTYNGDGIRCIPHSEYDGTPFAKRRSANVYGQFNRKYHIQGNEHIFENFSISEVLQLLLEHTHIAIISGTLASRGISFVSSDYSTHLTDQYLYTSSSSHGENILQSLRILGCYKDTEPLTLWCSERIWKQLLDHNKLVNKFIEQLSDSREWMVKLRTIEYTRPESPVTRPKLNPLVSR